MLSHAEVPGHLLPVCSTAASCFQGRLWAPRGRTKCFSLCGAEIGGSPPPWRKLGLTSRSRDVLQLQERAGCRWSLPSSRVGKREFHRCCTEILIPPESWPCSTTETSSFHTFGELRYVLWVGPGVRVSQRDGGNTLLRQTPCKCAVKVRVCSA